MTDTEPTQPEDAQEGSNVTPIEQAPTARSRDVTPRFKEGSVPNVPPNPRKSTKKASAKKATPRKATAAKKATTTSSGVVRSASVVSKEGTKKDEFTGEELPVTAFPTVRNPDTGKYDMRGPVARKNLEAYRAHRRQQREAGKAAAATKRAQNAKKAAPRKAAAKKAAARG